jgi:hypothetical protein
LSPIIGRNDNASFMEMLDVVDIVVPPLALFDAAVDRDGEEDDGEDDEGEEGDEGDEDKCEEEGVVRSRPMERRRRKEGPTTTRK